MLRVAVCDDNSTHLEYTKQLTEKILNDMAVDISEYSSANQLLFKIEADDYRPDIALLDIEMPDIDGIDLANELNRLAPECKIIFITSFLVYAPDVYDAEHVYFVLKSQIENRLPDALNKAIAAHNKPKPYMNVKTGSSVCRIPLDKVLYLERILHKTCVVTADGKYMTTQSPTDLLSSLPSNNAWFFRCHQSYWVNASAITTMEADRFLLDGGIEIPISRAKKSEARDAFFRFIYRKI